MKSLPSREELEALYEKYNKRKFVHPDPLEFLYEYEQPLDVEIVGLIASSLAYGNVKQILRSISAVLAPMGSSPSRFLSRSSAAELLDVYSGFKHRFTTADELVDMLVGVIGVIDRYGSLGECVEKLFLRMGNMVQTQAGFVSALIGPKRRSSLLPDVTKGSASKRLNLYFRWMVRHDEVDLGIWSSVPKSELIIPLDTHIYAFSTSRGITNRKSADLKTALEITRFFARINPEDPIKYDFAITRPGIGGH